MSEKQFPETLPDLLRMQAAACPDAPALWCEGRALSVAELDHRSNQCAQALLRAGVRPGERIAVLTKSNEEFFVLLFGAAKARACLLPINWRLAVPEVAFILQDSVPVVLVVDAACADIGRAALESCSSVRICLTFGAASQMGASFDAWYGKESAIDPQLNIGADEHVLQLYTSGTTGRPKGACLSHGNYQAFFASALPSWAKWQAGKSALIAVPLFHVAGVNTTLLALAQGARAVLVADAAPQLLLRLLVEQSIAYAFLGPTLINMILQTEGADTADYSTLECIWYGSSPIAEDVLTRALARFNCNFIQLYGSTETLGAGTYLASEAHDPKLGKLRSCGKPWPGLEVRVVRADGTLAHTEETGEVQMRSTMIIDGYWNRPEVNREVFDEQRWFKMGDAGYLDADGFLFIRDRLKDTIISGGENVYPAEVESALMSHPSVSDAAVIGVPDERWGEAVKAIVVLRRGVKTEAEEILRHIRGLIAGYKVPKSLDFVSDLPRNASGKVLRRELREPYWAGRDRRVS